MATRVHEAYAATEQEKGRIEDLVLQHLPLVKRIVGHFLSDLTVQISEEDLMGAGTLGLVEAAQRFNCAKGVKFGTFAYPRVRGEIIDFLRGNDSLARSARTRLRTMRQATRRFQAENGRKPGIGELAEAMEMSEHDVLKYLSYEKWDCVRSLDTGMHDREGHESPLKALVASGGDSPLAGAEWHERVEQLTQAIDSLSEREKLVIVLYYCKGLYMAEIAAILAVSEARVSQLHTRALDNLADKLEE